MTRVLFHSYFFPPIGGAGAQRPLKMVRHLSDAGYRCIVVTAPGPSSDRWSPTDETLMREVPADAEVHRVPGPGPEPSGRWKVRAERWLARPCARERWWVETSTRVGLEVAKDSDLVYVWMQPYESARSGVALARALERPWVADLGDPWALDEMRVYPSAFHRWLDRREMRSVLRTASAIVMSTAVAARRLLEAFPELEQKNVVVIPNGFDAADFAPKIAPRNNGKFWVVHTGYLHTELGRQLRRRARFRRVLGGSVAGLDILTRSHVFLVQAIGRVLERDPSAADVLELHLAGVLTPTDEEVAARCPVAKLHGYVTHAQSIALVRSADLLFLPMQDLPTGTPATIVPGKTYEYLAAERPVLGAVPDGDAHDILTAAGNARLCRPADVECLANAVLAELARFRRGDEPARPRPEVVAQYEYGELARRLANVFDVVLERREALRLPCTNTRRACRGRPGSSGRGS